jgi:ornithine carbamoyltransferase
MQEPVNWLQLLESCAESQRLRTPCFEDFGNSAAIVRFALAVRGFIVRGFIKEERFMASNAYAVKENAAIEERTGTVALAGDTLAGRDLCSIADFSPPEVAAILELAHAMKAAPEEYRFALDARQMVMFCEKASLRTRLTFEAGINTLGGSAIFVDQTQSPLGERESIPDIARNLERWVSLIVLRTYAHETITEMAEHANVPIINALSDLEHPCQALADFMTVEERFGSARGLKFVYVGDGNNVCHSLMLTAAQLGAHCTVATPKGYAPNAEKVKQARKIGLQTGGTLTLMTDPLSAVSGAHCVYTDVCTSMGLEHEATKRAPIFKPYQVNDALMAQAAPDAIFMHCLPAHRNAEVTDSVLDGPQSVVFDQAENRMHAQKALMVLLMNGRVKVPRGTAPGKRVHRQARKSTTVPGLS